ncbi:phage tail terminator family protein [Paenibacillus sp. KN14-4R]|uniref:phage tail terminator family protein n=1 Tax=Paenibacillus sp. KN14-4R TaxID=3445773 RepID=UPI003F9F21C9
MLLRSLDTICAKLKYSFPDVTTIYVHNLPDNPVTPAFLIQLSSSTNEDLSYKKYASQAVWQLTYYSAQDVGNKGLDQVDRLDRIQDIFMATPILKGRDGSSYHIQGVETGLRDTELFVRITLQTEFERTSEQHQDVKHVSIRT